GPRRRGAEGGARRLRLGQPRPGRLGRPLGGRFADAQPGEPRQGPLGGLGEAGLHAGQADGLVGGRGQVVAAQAQQFVTRAGAVVAGGAEVVVAAQAERAEQAQGRAPAEALAAGVALAAGAGHAGALVPPFFRSSRAAWRAWAPRRWTASRTANSVLPRSWPSGLVARRRASRRASSRKGCCISSKRRWASASCSGVRGVSVTRELLAGVNFRATHRPPLI